MTTESTTFVTSKDGTKLAYDKVGSGPAVILIGGAMVTRADAAELAKLLAPQFTVYNYDRRDRGESNDTKPFALAHVLEREIEDLEAFIDLAGGSAYVYGISSGACLALQAAAALGNKVKKLALYEAPYNEGEGGAEEWKTYRTNVEKAIAENRPGDAVELFMKLVGVPEEMVAGMKGSPMWPGMEAVAPTLPYDAAAIGVDRSVPVERAAQIKAQTLVMDGGANLQMMPFMNASANKIADAIPNAERQTLEGQDHNVNPAVLAPVLIEFFSK